MKGKTILKHALCMAALAVCTLIISWLGLWKPDLSFMQYGLVAGFFNSMMLLFASTALVPGLVALVYSAAVFRLFAGHDDRRKMMLINALCLVGLAVLLTVGEILVSGRWLFVSAAYLASMSFYCALFEIAAAFGFHVRKKNGL